MGRRREPAAVQAAKGNPGKRRVVETEPAAVAAETPRKIEPPRTLNRDERRVWDKLAPELTRINMVRPTDHEALVRYCYDLECWWKWSRRIKKEGITYESDSKHGSMKRVHPLLHATMKLEHVLLQFEDRFGMSPASRQALLLKQAAQSPGAPGGLFDKKGETAPPPAAESPIGILSTGERVH